MALLEIKNLKTCFYLEGGESLAVDDVSLDVGRGETVALVGESGSGKTILSLSILDLVPPPGRITGGSILFEGKNILELPEREMQRIRGKNIAMVFQEPLSSLNPLFTAGFQITESLIYHLGLSSQKAKKLAIELLDEVEISDPDLRFYDYPHQLSGGMRQRVMIAIGISCKPKLLILDEPTTALDVTIQAQIIELIEKIKKLHNMSFILISHDLAIVEDLSDRIAIMYAGKIVEYAASEEIFKNARHPYTKGLISSVPDLEHPRQRLKTISGAIPQLSNKPSGCPFHPRCERRIELCDKAFPEKLDINPTHLLWCYNPVATDTHG